MKRVIYLTAVIFLISLISINFSQNAAIALQESSESVAREVEETEPDYTAGEEANDEEQHIYIRSDYNIKEE